MIEINTAAKKVDWGEKFTSPEAVLAAFRDGAYISFFQADENGFEATIDHLNGAMKYTLNQITKWFKVYNFRPHLHKKSVVYRPIVKELAGLGCFFTMVCAPSRELLDEKIEATQDVVEKFPTFSQPGWRLIDKGVMY